MAEDDDWKYAVEDFEDPDENQRIPEEGQATDVFGDASVREDLEPGSPSFENALFVLLGAALALVILLGV